ncbi:Major Facilitator Superfamily protein [Shimia gijangensis]|uniref:Major Facilitator Superfamily protein n=1 Tax=Shimia gijangensis TaxID=1470563 RepID=A0A1M6IE57_9RHOB|nr:MFS transporter [Shimia gijangensis]SHJ32673.1 Major Facilitator Superfamily protein [Shimia gijangensis]
MLSKMTLDEARSLPKWRQPVGLLFVMAIAMPIAFYVWSALLNNFVKEVAGFDGFDISALHFVREIPGFLAFLVVFLIIVIREQVLGLVSLVILGIGTAFTAWFPSLQGLLVLTFISSLGFHYYETVNQSLQLQWLSKERAPHVLGWLMGAGSASMLVVYVLIVLMWDSMSLSYNIVYMVGGLVTTAIALFCFVAYPQFESPTPQAKKIVLRKRYWLYYALQFMSGARRQIITIFAGYMMVAKFGLAVHEVTGLYLINLVVNTLAAPFVGKAVARFGERVTLIFEYGGLVLVFLAYSGVYWFGWGILVASALYVVDHILFGLALALKTYFQKIADPQDIAPTAAVAFTINHIAAVLLPLPLGLLWLYSPAAVFSAAAVMALISLGLSLLVPRHPEKGNETRFSQYRTAPAE